MVDTLIKFIKSSPKRDHALGRKMPKPRDTHWLSRDTAFADEWYEEIGSFHFDLARESNEKPETRATVTGLCMQMKHVEFYFDEILL